MVENENDDFHEMFLISNLTNKLIYSVVIVYKSHINVDKKYKTVK